MKRLAMALVLFAATPALADGVINDCQPNHFGCACEQEVHICEPPNDLHAPIIHDLGVPASDLTRPSGDEGLDARRERRRRRNAASGRGLVLLSGASALLIVALRRRYKTMRPTPADSALAASATRSDS